MTSPLAARRHRGFTLVELLVVVLVIGILAAIALPRLLGQRSRARNTAAQAAVRHALLAARSYYTQNSESYAGLDGAALKGYESSLSGTEPADSQQPGSSANPQDIWIGNGSDGTNPTDQTVVLCSTSKGDAVYCARDVGGLTGYLRNTSTTVITASSGAYTQNSGNERSVVSVSAGNRHSCALISDGTAKCWGYNEAGMLGDGTTTDRTSPVTVQGLTGAVSLTASGNHTCALISDGTVRCWGRNGQGQLGDGSSTHSTCVVSGVNYDCSLVPVQVSGINNAVSLVSGQSHTCVLLQTGELRCWGMNNRGQLGDGTTTDRSTPITPSWQTGLNIKSISLGNEHSCLLLQDGTVRCWGSDSYLQLGDGDTSGGHSSCGGVDCALSPVVVSGLGGVAQVVAGGWHNCAILVNTTLQCWGYNGYRQLSDGTTTYRSSPVPTLNSSGTALSGVSRLALGYAHGCAIMMAGDVQCWGLNSRGQLGDGTTTNRGAPVAAQLAVGTSLTSGRYDANCAVELSGAVRCWGYNSYGGLGDGTTTDQLTPVRVNGLP